MPKQEPQIFYVIDISLREKFMALAYSGSAGSIAGLFTKEAVTMGIKALSLGALFPEFTGTLIGVLAFSHMAAAATNTWLKYTPPNSLRLRQRHAPKINL